MNAEHSTLNGGLGLRRRELLKGMLGCGVAPVCPEISVKPVVLPGWLKLRQKGMTLVMEKHLTVVRAADGMFKLVEYEVGADGRAHLQEVLRPS